MISLECEFLKQMILTANLEEFEFDLQSREVLGVKENRLLTSCWILRQLILLLLSLSLFIVQVHFCQQIFLLKLFSLSYASTSFPLPPPPPTLLPPLGVPLFSNPTTDLLLSSSCVFHLFSRPSYLRLHWRGSNWNASLHANVLPSVTLRWPIRWNPSYKSSWDMFNLSSVK